MRKLLLLLPILLLTACSSLDFQIRTLHTANMYDGIYYNTPTRINSNFVFFQPNIYDDFWWNYSLTYPLNWNHFSSYGLSYNWRYTRWNSNQWLINPYYDQFRIAPLYTPNIVRNRGRRSNTRVSIPRTPVRVNTSAIRSINTRNTQARPVRTRLNNQLDNDVRRLRNNNVKVRVINDVREGRHLVPNSNTPKRVIQRPNTQTPQRTQVRQPQPPQRTQVREAVKQTQPTRRSSNVVIKNKRNQ